MNKNKIISLVLVIIVVLGFLGYLMYSKNKNVSSINDLTPTSNTSIIYTNNELGLIFTLPDSWKGYSIVNNTWEGNPLKSNGTQQTGPKLLIRNPKWTSTLPYEDIPIMVFTLSQWDSYLAENFSVLAAPIQASELGRNNVYVFALPPRWDFDYSEGYVDAQNIMKSNPLKTFNTENNSTSYKNATYTIDGHKVMLINGQSETQIIPGSASKIVTKYFGNEVLHDFNGDGRQDVAFILTQNTGGSGTFFYVVGALNTPQGWIGSDAVLLGDRISPQTTGMSQNQTTPNVFVVNYADRKAGESFAVKPSVGKSIWLLLDPKTMKWGEVAQNFEGEANPAQMTLGMKKWVWVKAIYSNDTILVPKKVDAFTLTFSPNGNFSATTDCNSVAGKYTVKDTKITFSDMASTLMYCDGSQEADFTKLLTETQSYIFTSKGELVLNLKMDSGSVIFR